MDAACWLVPEKKLTKLSFKMCFIDHGGPGSRFVVGECYENIRIVVMSNKASARFSSEVSGLPVKGSVVGGLALSRSCLYSGKRLNASNILMERREFSRQCVLPSHRLK